MLAEPKVTKDIVYQTVAGQELKLDLYQPAVPTVSPSPLVIVIHGGAWMAGNRADMASLCEAIAKNGMTAATVSYRLAPKSKWPAMLDDVQSAVRFLRAKSGDYAIDPNRIGATGASAGGHLAMLLALRPTRDTTTTFYAKESSQVKAVFNIFGPYDLSQDFDPQLANLVSFQILGKALADAQKDILDFSPSSFMTKGVVPIFTLHGDADRTVPVQQAKRLDEKMKEIGSLHELVIIEGMGHNIDQKNTKVMDAVQRGIDFLKTHLTK